MSLLSKFTIDKQLAELAKNWYFKNELIDEPLEVKEKFFQKDKDYYVKLYLKEHPTFAKQYNRKFQKLKKASTITGALSISAFLAAGALYVFRPNPTIEQNTPTKYESTTEYNNDENISAYDEMYNAYSKKVSSLDNIKDIHEYTKELITKSYNRSNPESKISNSELGITISNPSFLNATVDSLGNVVSYRIGPSKGNEKSVEGRTVYQFSVSDNVVSCYDKMGTKINNDNIKNEIDFSMYVDLVNKSENLKNMYTHPSNEYEQAKAKKEYIDSILNTLYPDIEKDNENHLTLE